MRHVPGSVFAAMAACAAVIALFAIGRAQAGDPNAACVSNASRLVQGLWGYTQDWDEVFPPMWRSVDFQQSLMPYVKDPAAFICPATGLPYTPVGALSYRPIASFSFSDPGSIPVLYDSRRHPDGKATLAFFDDRILRGGVLVPDPYNTCDRHVKRLAAGLIMYAQDHDGYLPPMQSQADFKYQMRGYARFRYTFFCPETQQPYAANLALSGHALTDFSNPDAVEVVRDSNLHSDGTVTIGYLSGRTERKSP